jgi:hypothetical protein
MIREALISELKSELNKNKLDNRPLQIAIVGGSSQEPELALFPKDSKVTYFGISKGLFDEPFVYLDANFFPNELSSDYLNAFDIVICINVLEHLFSATNGFANLCSLLNTNG